MIKKLTYFIADKNIDKMDSKSFLDLNLALNRLKELNNPEMEIHQYIKEYKNKEFQAKFNAELEIIKGFQYV